MDWLNGLLLLAVIGGHAVLWIAFVNRTHGLPWSSRTLKRLRHLHDAMLLIFPPVLIWCVGLSGPQLLRGGSWSSVPLFWKIICLIGGSGWLWLIWVHFRRRWTRLPRHAHVIAEEIFDVQQQLGFLPLHSGPYARLAQIPGNGQFCLDVSTKQLRLPQLPAEWDGLSILHLSDFHFSGTVRKEYFVKSLELAMRNPCDLLCFTGDLLDDLDCLTWLPETLGRLSAPLGRFFILGNHDWYLQPEVIRQGLSECGWQDLGGRSMLLPIKGRTCLIAGDETPWMGGHPPGDAPADFRLSLSHTPDNIQWARRQSFDLMLSGHNHGGQVRLPGIGAVYSPSLYGTRYAEGTFQESPTLLHVSRGLSGQHPLRLRCLPEITRLILRPGRFTADLD